MLSSPLLPLLWQGLSLGTTSILDELRWVAAASARTPSLRYLYLGFYSYCHPRLEYKLQFKPNQLLCPYTLHWVPSDKALPRMTRGSESAPLGNLGFLSWLLAPDRGASKAQAWVRACHLGTVPLPSHAHTSAPVPSCRRNGAAGMQLLRPRRRRPPRQLEQHQEEQGKRHPSVPHLLATGTREWMQGQHRPPRSPRRPPLAQLRWQG